MKPTPIEAKPAKPAPANVRRLIGKLEVQKADLKRALALRNEVTLLEAMVSENCRLSKAARVVMETVAAHFEVSIDLLRSRNREEWVALPRQVVFFILRAKTPSSLAAIGKLFRRDHGTVMHAVRAISDRRTVDAQFARKLSVVEQVCASRLALEESENGKDNGKV